MLAHAALESGWGRHEPRSESGLPSHNLFGIKAGRAWDGAVAGAQTNEFEGGRWQRQAARFRAYSSYAEGFADYAHMLRERFGITGNMSEAEFAGRLADAGYATDPTYADKLTRVLGSDVLRAALAASG
jgi:flagellar protein FlgJ